MTEIWKPVSFSAGNKVVPSQFPRSRWRTFYFFLILQCLFHSHFTILVREMSFENMKLVKYLPHSTRNRGITITYKMYIYVICVNSIFKFSDNWDAMSICESLTENWQTTVRMTILLLVQRPLTLPNLCISKSCVEIKINFINLS